MRPAARRSGVVLALGALCGSALLGGPLRPRALHASARAAAMPRDESTLARPLAEGPRSFTLSNRFAYIPPQCYTETRDASGRVHNPCLACHMRSEPPNFADDGELQRILSLPSAAAANPWTNLLDPPTPSSSPGPRCGGECASDPDILAYVRHSNYLADDGATLTLARTIEEADRGWRGYRPDAWYAFDDRGFDRRPDGIMTGWRAFAYYPFPGTFFPTNGSMDDVLIRLDPALQQDESGQFDRTVYEVNLAIVEALVKRAPVAIEPVDEAALHADLDLDGKIGRATYVAFDGDDAGRTRMRYVGRARLELEAGRFPIAPGLFPLSTEFLHSVRYLDVDANGRTTFAARMKELRYAKKVRWLSYGDLRAEADRDALEQARSVDGVVHYAWHLDRGIYNGQGWLLQGFIETSEGDLRPQSFEESLYCAGCHGGIGATVDSVFSLARKLGADSPARGWFHWTQRDLRGAAEPRTREGAYEYTRYLEANGAGDELRENTEVKERFFEDRGGDSVLRPAAVERLHEDVSTLLLPSAARALDLDRAYRAIVQAQTFTRGRGAVLAAATNVYVRAPIGQATGIEQPW